MHAEKEKEREHQNERSVGLRFLSFTLNVKRETGKKEIAVDEMTGASIRIDARFLFPVILFLVSLLRSYFYFPSFPPFFFFPHLQRLLEQNFRPHWYPIWIPLRPSLFPPHLVHSFFPSPILNDSPVSCMEKKPKTHYTAAFRRGMRIPYTSSTFSPVVLFLSFCSHCYGRLPARSAYPSSSHPFLIRSSFLTSVFHSLFPLFFLPLVVVLPGKMLLFYFFLLLPFFFQRIVRNKTPASE